MPKAATSSPSTVDDPEQRAESGPVESVTRYSYDFYGERWVASCMNVRLAPLPFGEGCIRSAHHMVDTAGNRYVAKFSKIPCVGMRYFEEVMMQATCQYYADLFNETPAPKKVRFVEAFVILRTQAPGRPVAACEAFIPGQYTKYNNNSGWRKDDRNTPQAFSHFTHCASKGTLMVVDIQGVGDLYTDPQVHSVKYSFGPGDMGPRGFRQFFRTHRCNNICIGLGLSKAPVSNGGGGTQLAEGG
eukprot:EG_transcript_25356